MPRLDQLPEWKALEDHFSEMEAVHLRELFSNQPDRAERLSIEDRGILLDYSKNRVTGETMEKLLALARAAGLDVQVWTVNDPAEMRWLADEMKVAGIMTDDPGLLEQVIKEFGGA